MKIIFAFLAFCLVSFSYSSSADWHVIAESGIDCKENFKILAKEGEKFVVLDQGNEKLELESKDGSKFDDSSPVPLTFVSTKKNGLNTKKFTFTQPSMMDRNRAVVEIENGMRKENCKVQIK